MAVRINFMLYPQLMDVCSLRLGPFKSNRFRSSFGMTPKSPVMTCLSVAYLNGDKAQSHNGGLLIK